MNKGRIEADVTRSIQKVEAVSTAEILMPSVIDLHRSRRLIKMLQPGAVLGNDELPPIPASTTAVNAGPTTVTNHDVSTFVTYKGHR